MREVEPGTIVTVDERGIRERTYWRLESRLHTDDLDTTVARVRELLDDIVRRELVADVPVCVLLSGGLDSSAITALAAGDLSTAVRTFSVEFTGQADNFTPTDTHPTLDTPYIREVAQHVGSEHHDIAIDHRQLSDPAVRRKVVAALDLPTGGGEQDASLYLLFKAIREQSTVALSGEASDEIFGGYRQFHDPGVQLMDAFPWIAIGASWTDPTGYILTPELRAALNLETYLQDRYVDAVAEVERVAGEDEFTHRMRVMSYLHLTRFVRILLDRNDRMSMAVGLEVRVPFCDHRLVEYVYNTPWSMKSYDGREKSLLRGAVRDILPESVVQRVKSRYPSTADPQYGAQIQAQARELLAGGNDTLFSVVDRHALEHLTRIDAESLGLLDRFRLERVLDLSVWIDLYRPHIIV
jgi:asparagine synthase (glutamine-hydrolysing)